MVRNAAQCGWNKSYRIGAVKFDRMKDMYFKDLQIYIDRTIWLYILPPKYFCFISIFTTKIAFKFTWVLCISISDKHDPYSFKTTNVLITR